MRRHLLTTAVVFSLLCLSVNTLSAQEGPRTGGGGLGGRGFGGPGGPMGGREMKVVKQFDVDGDGILNQDERTKAREFVRKERAAGRGGRGFGGPGGPGGGPGGMLASQMLSQADKDNDQKLTKEEFSTLGDKWFAKLDADQSGKLSQDQLAERMGDLLPMPQFLGGGPGGPGRPAGPGGPPGFRPGQFIAPGLFATIDRNKDASLTGDEWKATFEKWFTGWDADKNASLNEDELRTGLAAALPPPQFGGRSGPGGSGGGRGFGRRENQPPPKPGPRVSQADVKTYPHAPLYEPTVLRTLFFDFDSNDWEAELSDLRNTDVEIPATLTVDGKTYPNVGVHFRGMSSLGMVGDGFKRSLAVSMDLVDSRQKLYGHKSLNLLNSHADASFLHPVLYSHVARQHIPAPKVNFVKVVINGESWGVYANAEQFNKDMLKAWFPGKDGGPGPGGARWKVPGSPGGRSGLEYLGEDPAPYRQRYEIKSADVPQVWRDLIALCRTLNETPPEQLEAALEPILNVDGVLWFLAMENVFINGDGYWIRASDFSLYQDTHNKFHVLPSDMNETFVAARGPGMGRGGPGGFGGARGGPGTGPGGRGPGGPAGEGDVLVQRGPGRFGGGGGGRGAGLELDPLVGLDDTAKPLRSKLLAVPALRARYLDHVRALAEKWLDWQNLGPVVQQYRSLIEKEVEADTRKLEPFEAFIHAVADAPEEPRQAAEQQGPGPRGRRSPGLRGFAEQRRAYLLSHPEVKKSKE